MRNLSWIFGLGLILVAVFLPRQWYDQLPKPKRSLGEQPIGEQPIKGVTLIQICFGLDGLLLIAYGARKSRKSSQPIRRPPMLDGADGMPSATAQWLLLLITAVGFGLRLYKLDADLWLDEITPLYDYGAMSAFHVIVSYTNANNHLLNTLLVKGIVSLTGPQEWAIRLPAVLFGTATIPVAYWVARSVLSRGGALCVAVLLAVSYHHIFFSQNARGYSAYLFFSLLTSGLLLRGMQIDRIHTWWLYTAAMVLNFAANLLALFVFAAHVITGSFVLLKMRAKGIPVEALRRRLLVVTGITGLLGFHLYAAILPQAYVFIRAEYVQKWTGFAAFSREHAAELIRGLSSGFGIVGLAGILLIMFVAGLGFVELWSRRSALALMLVLPEVMTAGGLLLAGLHFTPRFFLLGLPLTLICLVTAVDSIGEKISGVLAVDRTKLTAAAISLVGIASLAALPIYYSRPKQDFRGAIRYVEQHRASGDLVLPLSRADWGYRFYGGEFGLVEGKDYFPARSLEELESVLREHPTARRWAVMTLPRILRLEQPELYMKVHNGWSRVVTFPGTIGDGEVSVWLSDAPK